MHDNCMQLLSVSQICWLYAVAHFRRNTLSERRLAAYCIPFPILMCCKTPIRRYNIMRTYVYFSLLLLQHVSMGDRVELENELADFA